MADKSITATRMKVRREKLGVQQKELASLIGTTQSQISEYENGRHSPPAEIVASIAKALRVSADWLLGLSDDPIPSRRKSDLTDKQLMVLDLWEEGNKAEAAVMILTDKTYA